MALWNNISKKASAVTEKAVQQAKDLTELAKLHAQAAQAEGNLTDSYTQIGRLYAADHPEDFPPAYAPLMAAVADAEKQIASLRAQIRDIRGVAVCPGCGAEVARDAAFCSACGAEMPKPAPVEAEIVTEDDPDTQDVPENSQAPAAQAPGEEAAEAAPVEQTPAGDMTAETASADAGEEI